jgi:HEAT repeat protein
VHGILSPDSEVTQVERITTQLAEGNDFFTLSEHEIRADYSPFVNAMGVQNLIATAVSAEITTFDYGHFNSWPVTVDPSAVNGGTVDWGRAGVAPGADFPSAGSYNLSPQEIYAVAHSDPKTNLIQINHMRSHFNTDGLDIDTAITPPLSHTPGAARRLDPIIPNYFDAGFDALEVWIGTDGRNGDQQHFVRENLGDWINMLNQGIVAAGVADSDTHERRTTQINAHTLVASAVTNPGLLWTEDENLAQSVVMGHATGTNAPFLTVTATTPLGTAGLTNGANTMIATNDGTATIDVTVKSPLWAPFDKIEFYVNNAPQAYDHDNNAGTRNRYRVIPNATTNGSPTLVDDFPSIPGAKHWEATAQLNLASLATDTWVIVLVRGTDNVSQPLFPVIPNSLVAKACSNDPCRGCSVNADCVSGGTCTGATNPDALRADRRQPEPVRRAVARLLEPTLHRRQPEQHVRSAGGHAHPVRIVAVPSLHRLAGALRAPAALLALVAVVGLAPLAQAHGPVRRRPATEPAPGMAVPPDVPLDPDVIRKPEPAPSGAVPTTGLLALREIAADSTLVADGVVTHADSLDDDRLRVHHLRVDRTTRGTADGDALRIIEMRGAATRPPLLADGARVLLLLRPAPALSYLTQHLPPGAHWALAGGRDGIVPLASDDERRVVDETLAEGARIGSLDDKTAARTARRALAFRELGTLHPRLAADALVELRRLDEVTHLAPDEITAFGRVLATRAISPVTRTGLAQLAGERGWKEAVPALRAAETETSPLFDAVLVARARLGAPPDREELTRYLGAKDATMRAAALRALAATSDPAIGEIGHYATADPDVEVRVAAIDALGSTKKSAAVPTLSRTLTTSDRAVRQASGRALLAIGGPAANDAFVDLALHGNDAETRSYAALLLVLSNGRDSAPVQKLLAANPSGEVRNVIEHGLQWNHMHGEAE